jgi:hypothetical protein
MTLGRYSKLIVEFQFFLLDETAVKVSGKLA